MLSELYSVDAEAQSAELVIDVADPSNRHGVLPINQECGGGYCYKNYERNNRRNIRRCFCPVKGLSPADIICSSSVFNEGIYTFAYGLKRGSLLLVTVQDIQNDSAEVQEIQQTSRYYQLLSGLGPSLIGKQASDVQESPIDVAFIQLDGTSHLIASIGRDHHLRMWDIQKKICVAELDLLGEFCQRFHPFKEHSSTSSQRHMSFAAGARHRIRGCQNHSQSESYAVIYLEVVPTEGLITRQLPLACWVWVRVDLSLARQGSRQSASVLRMDPIRSVKTALEQLADGPKRNPHAPTSHPALIDFLPCVLSCRPTENPASGQSYGLVKESSGLDSSGMSMSLDNGDPELMKDQLFGLWSLFDVPLDESAGLSNQASLQWSYFRMGEPLQTVAALPPDISLGDVVPTWQRPLPEEMFDQVQDEGPFATPDSSQASPEDGDEMTEQAEEDEVEAREKQASTTDITEFLDCIFQPTLFSKFAIYNALQSTLQCHNRPIARIRPNESLESLRITVTRHLSTELRPLMSATEFKNLLYAFHASVMDYHTQGCQPVGLFNLTPSLRNVSDCELGTNIVVVRKSGFSVPRRLQSTEETFWMHNRSSFAYESEPQSLYEQTQAIQLFTRESLLARCRALVRNLSSSSAWLSHDREVFHNLDNFANPKAVLIRLLEEFEAEAVQEGETVSCSHLLGDTLLTSGASEIDHEDVFAAFLWVSSQLEAPDLNANLDELNDVDEDDDLEEEAEEEKEAGIRRDFSRFGRGSYASGDLDASKRLRGERRNGRGSPNWSALSSRVAAELLCRGFLQTTESRRRFCVALFLLWIKFKEEVGISAALQSEDPVETEEGEETDTPSGVGPASTPVLLDSDSVERFENRLMLVYRSLLFNKWLVSTRRPVNQQRGDGTASLARMHLRLLGMQPLPETSDQSDMETADGDLTLFEELYLTNPHLRLCRTFRGAWDACSSSALAFLQKSLCPILAEGAPLLPVFRHLLMSARCEEILSLCKFLSPSTFASQALTMGDRCGKTEHLDLDPWWPFDSSLLYVSFSLALLWLGLTDEAVDQFIEGSVNLRNCLRSLQLVPFTSSTANTAAAPHEPSLDLARSEPPTLSAALLSRLLPGEFGESLFGDLQLAAASPTCALLLDEIQIRFLMRLIPVLEKLEKSEQVIRICEHALLLIERAVLSAVSEGLISFEGSTMSPVDTAGGGYPLADRAFSHLSALSAASVCAKDEKLIAATHSLAELTAALHTRIFKHQLALGNTDRAYALVMSNPDKARQRDCLHMFVTTLCDRGETAALVNFDYGALESEVIATIEARAKTADIFPSNTASREAHRMGPRSLLRGSAGDVHAGSRATTDDQADFLASPFYDLLFAFYVHRSRFRSAAEVCFEQALRLAEEISDRGIADTGKRGQLGGARVLALLQQQALCLSNTVNLLQLAPPEDQWLIQPASIAGFIQADEKEAEAEEAEANFPATENEEEDSNIFDDWAFEPETHAVEEEVEDYVDAVANGAKGDAPGSVSDYVLARQAKGRRILTLADIQRQYVFLRARLRLAQVSWEQGMLRVGSTSLAELYQTLTSSGLFHEAFRLMSSFSLDPKVLVSAVASRCATLAQHKLAANKASVLLGNDALPSSLPALASSTSPLALEQCLVLQSFTALIDAFPEQAEATAETADDNWTGGHTLSSDLLTLYWGLLRILLTNLDGAAARRKGVGAVWDLALTALHILLASEPQPVQIPGWLTQLLLRDPFTASGKAVATSSDTRPLPSAVTPYLRLLLKFDRLQEAYRLSCDILASALGPEAVPLFSSVKTTNLSQLKIDIQAFPHRVTSAAFCLPHSLLLHLLAELDHAAKNSSVHAAMHTELSNLLRRYYSTLLEVHDHSGV
ncbi:hypothetical protein SprV_0200926800 [Sparganum proliferum]